MRLSKRPALHKAYTSRRAGNGTWAVFDVASNLPVITHGKFMTGLVYEDARDLANVLSRGPHLIL